MPAYAEVKKSTRTDTIVALLLIGILGLMIVPLPPALMDTLISLNISISLAVFLVAVYITKPLDFSVFPSLLLFVTLFRLALNIASTRLILLNGGTEKAAAGRIIEAFGHFVVGGNYTVGIILFLILVVINFVVITKGAGRIAEVSARFTLDAMPGKQMSIDADLQAGLINEAEARRRRRAIEQEADFYGAMDGASKFVRGDAIAGLVITFINIVGGIIIGAVQKDLSLAQAAHSYTILTVGDGLVSQIPALLVSTAAGVVVTRSGDDGDLTSSLIGQVAGQRKVAMLVALVMGFLALLPGMPHMVMFTIAAGAALIAYYLPSDEERAMQEAQETEAQRDEESDGGASSEREEIAQMLPVDPLALELGFELVPLVNSKAEGGLLSRISGLRKQFALEMGFLIPPVHIQDNMALAPGEYRILIAGSEVARGEVKMGKLMAMDGGAGDPDLPGIQTTEPAFGLPAKWIDPSDRELAEISGYTVVDPATVIITHLSEIVRQNSPELLGIPETQELVDVLAKQHPRLVEDVVPNLLTLPETMMVLRGLLSEGVSIRDMKTIFETLAVNARNIKDPDQLVELCRAALGRQIVSRLRSQDGKLYALVMDGKATEAFRQAMQRIPDNHKGLVPMELDEARGFLSSINNASQAFARTGTLPVLVTEPDVRRAVWELVSRYVPGLVVLSYREIDRRIPIQPVGTVTI